MKNVVFILTLLALISCGSKTSKQSNNPESENKTTPIVIIDNFLKGRELRTRPLLCLDETVEQYTLTTIDTTHQFNYGDFVAFTDSVNFISYYAAPCGNDCFPSVYGKYRLTAETELLISVDSVTYDGDCYQPTKFPAKNEIPFIVAKNNTVDTIQLQLKK